MNKMQPILEKIIKTTGKKVSYEEIGKAIGTSKQNVGFLVKNNSEISDERIKEIEKYFKINLTEVKELKSAEQEDCIVLPLIRASAGYGSYNSEQGQLAVSKNELIQIGYKKFETLTGVQIFNNSMFPTINDGDLLVCDKIFDFNSIRDKYIYVIRFGDRYFCKRLLCGLKSVTVKSDNPDYPPETIANEELEHLEIIGRVVMRITMFREN